jgi:hypothetical protein
VTEIKLTLIVLTLSTASVWAQQLPPDDKTPPDAAQVADKDHQEQKKTEASTQPQHQDMMFHVIPAYGLVDGANQSLPPLTSGQKFKLSRQYFNPYTVLFVAVEAGLNQAYNTPKDYGQGAEGYGKRYGAGFADGLTDSFFTTAVYPSLFHQDPRYYRLNNGGFWRRTGYAVSRILVTRQDSGRKAFNFSEILGSYTSSSIAMTYYPASERDFSRVARRAFVEFGFDAGFNVVKEFYPDILRKLFGKKGNR